MDTSGRVFELWVYLSTSPLTWLTVTIGAYIAAQRLAALSGFNPIVNPVLIAVVLVISILAATGTSYSTYFDGAQFVHFALGPATVALAVPLYRNRTLIRQNLVPVVVALVAGRRSFAPRVSPSCSAHLTVWRYLWRRSRQRPASPSASRSNSAATRP